MSDNVLLRFMMFCVDCFELPAQNYRENVTKLFMKCYDIITSWAAVPAAEGAGSEGSIVVAGVAGHFLAQPGGAGEGFVGAVQLDFGKDEPLVVAVKLVDFPEVGAAGDVVAGLVDAPRFAELQELKGVGDRDFVLPFVAGDSGRVACALDGEVGAFAFHAHAHRAFGDGGEIALADALAAGGFCLVAGMG